MYFVISVRTSTICVTSGATALRPPTVISSGFSDLLRASESTRAVPEDYMLSLSYYLAISSHACEEEGDTAFLVLAIEEHHRSSMFAHTMQLKA